MGNKRSRAVLVGLSAAAGAFAAAGMVSAAVAPTARADDSSEILADVTAVETAAHADFTTAAADFATGRAGDAAGLTALFEGLDDQVFGVPDTYEVGELDALYNVAVIPANTFSFTTPTLANYITEANTIYTTGMTDMTSQANDFAMGDYTDGAVFQDLGWLDIGTIPGQIEFIGAVEQLLASLAGT
jgi:NAD(P)-dependent dehydrogenase (short-subunit alcohol dehydrogenase family)